MKLYDLIGVLPEKTTIGNTEAEIADLEINSKLVREDSLFICLKGTAFDSHSCLSDLEAYGCAAIVCERKLETKIPQIIVPDSRVAMSLLAAQFYGNPAKKLKLIAVSGTNGKTTTTSMITTALELAGRDPSAVIGGKLPLINGYGKAGKGDDIVIEACEFAETFLKLTPYLSVVLNIDNDHLDYYGSMGELKFAFKRFALMTQFMIFANADDKNTMDVMYTLDRRVRTFAIDNHADYRAVNINEYKPGFFEFDLKEWNTTDTTRIRLSVPGRHNIYNALAMCAVCRFVGLSAEQCAEAALNFKGAGRRFEVYGECNGALVIDDYAHHPTELRATLNTAKEMGYKRLIAVHQPFTYSRTKMLFNDFVDVLKIPDITVLTPIMGSREPNDPTITSAKLAAQIPGSVLVNSLQEAADWVKQNAQPGDLVITLGCGDIYKASKMMVEKDQ